MTPPELQRLQELACRSRRRRAQALGLGSRVRLALAGLRALLSAWWGARRGVSPRVVEDRRRIGRRQLQAARSGRW